MSVQIPGNRPVEIILLISHANAYFDGLNLTSATGCKHKQKKNWRSKACLMIAPFMMIFEAI
jgi:hypothetical protein